MRSLRALADHSQERSLARRLRQRRFAFFRELLSRIPGPISILDVGGTEGYWLEMGYKPTPGTTITLANLVATRASAGFQSVAADARDLSQFADRSFDVAFSNSVIEHVGSFDDQQRMANEVRRVGRHYFVQTPNRYFPVEPHFLFPGFQFLPARSRAWLATHLPLGWYSYPRVPKDEAVMHATTIRLLGSREMRRLFPDGHFYRERFGGLTKSITAYAGWE